MPRLKVPFAAGFYVSQSVDLVNKRTVNMYPQVPQSGALNERALFHSPGIDSVATVDGGNSRGSIRFPDRTPYFVIGNRLVSIDQSENITDHGFIEGNADVSIATNGINFCIVDPLGKSYFFTPETDVLEEITDAAFLSFGQARTVAFKDGFYVFTTDELFFISSPKTVNDGKDFNALDFADAESSPDRIVKVHNNKNQLYILNRDTIEVYQTVATDGFPFQRITGAQIQRGCLAPNSVIEFDNGFTFLGGDVNDRPSLYKVIGSTAQRLSTSSIDQLLHESSEEEIFAARSFTFSQLGNVYYVLTVGVHTFVYDALASSLAGSPQWHERQTGITRGEGFATWRAVHGVLSFGKVFVGDDRSDRIGSINYDSYKEYDEPIERIVSTQPLTQLGERVFSHQVEMQMEAGQGDSETPDPQIVFDYSDDGGRSFSNEVPRSFGTQGQYEIVPAWARLGRIPNNRIMRWRTTEPVKVSMLAVYANAEVTSSG